MVSHRRSEPKKNSRESGPANELHCGEVTSAHCDCMTPTSLIIVADRGSLKAYRVNETPTRGPNLKLVQAFDVTDAHGKLLDKVTDLAGRYAASDGAGMHQASIAETKLQSETERRINRQLADQITHIAKSDGVEGWSFAAPASCHNAIIELLAPDVRDRIVEFVKSDLVKVEPAKLASHFRSLQPI
ncbi:MAG: hypothetical protein DMF04_05020 [Verrucomicrobia bacterium]|nr:MAG: hypothetical protein DMF04_05020 [Verrucomicrobiota bacterium]